MIAFWTLTALLASMAGLLVLSGARRGVDATAPVEQAAASAELDELDRLKSRGLLDDAAWAAARAEAGRRILSMRRSTSAATAGRRDRVWVLGLLGVAGAAALGLYAAVGAPGYADQPYALRVSQWAASPDGLEPAQLAAVVARAVEERPNDHQALTMLGAARFHAGDALGAASAFRRALAIRPDDAASWARLGESLVRASQGRVDGDAEAAFAEAVRLDPDQLGARYFLGEAALERGEAARVREMWEPLIAVLGPDDPRRADLQRRLPEAPR